MKNENKEQPIKEYKVSNIDKKIIDDVYSDFKHMRDDVMNISYPEFQDRTLKQFLDDSQKRANSYVPSKASQNKADWQANVFTQYTRNKIKAQLASIAKDIPKIKITATNEKNEISVERGDIMQKMTEASFIQGNQPIPQEIIFYDGWDGCINGTIIKYDGFLKTKNKVKVIEDFDITTGKIKYTEEEHETDNNPIEVNINVENFFIWDSNIRNVQDQPKLIWVEYYDKNRFDFEFGKYVNSIFVKTGSDVLQGEMDLFFGKHWSDRVEDKKYEIIRYYDKYNDNYYIISNGVLLLKAPMLWGKKRKYYPFAKQIYEPFANSNFFWGNSLPNILMGNQDVANAFINSMIDKTYRTLETPMLIGHVNRDSFDLEDEYITNDTKI